jgi:ABC-type sulfate transport system substrate-binding protein
VTDLPKEAEEGEELVWLSPEKKKRLQEVLGETQTQESPSASLDADAIMAVVDATVEKKLQSRAAELEQLKEDAASEILADPQGGFSTLFRGLAARKRRKP